MTVRPLHPPHRHARPLSAVLAAAGALVGAASAQRLVPTDLATIDAVPGIGAIRTGDFDGDGDADALLAGPDLFWRENAGDGSWRAGVRAIGLADAGRGPAPVVADFDGDLDLDVVAAAPAPVGFRLLRNDGSGTFGDATPAFPELADPRGRPLVADVDGDGRPEVLLPTAAGLRVLAVVAGAVVDRSAASFPGGVPGASAVAAADLDGDGRVDLMLGGDAVRGGDVVFVGTPRGFVPATFTGLRGSAAGPATVLELVDLDADGDLDLVVVHGGGLEVFDRIGAAAFAAHSAPLDADATDAVFVDLDGDGDRDLVSIAPGRGPVVWRNDGVGGFARDLGTPVAPIRGDLAALAVADVDGRHGPDLLFSRDVTELWLAAPSGWVRAAGPDVDVSFAVRPHDAADIDRDGDLDVVGVRDGAGGAEIVLGHNDGTGRLDWQPLPAPVAARIAFADVDGDGDADLLGAVGGAIGAPFPQPDLLWINDGAGRFADESATRLPRLREGTNRLAVADVDGDGDLDAILVGTRPVLYRNDGTGHFTEAVGALPGGALIATDGGFADLDGDGDLDFVIAYYDPFFGSVLVWRNDGGGRFRDVSNALPAGFTARARVIGLGDVDGDGDVDLVLGNVGAADEWLANDGTGRFPVANPLPGPAVGNTWDARLFDVDGDGDLDWLSARPAWSLRTNDGRGGFVASPLAPQAIGRRLLVADLDTDGDLDALGPFGRFANVGLHLAVPRLPRTAVDLVVRLAADAGVAVPAAAVVAPAGLVPPRSLPGVGTLRVRPGLTLALPAVTLAAGGAAVDLVFPIPADPRLIGLPLGFQAGYLLPTGIVVGNAVQRGIAF